MRLGIHGFDRSDTPTIGVTQGTTAQATSAGWVAPALAAYPLISGLPRDGETLTCNTAHLTNVVSYQWLDDGVEISGQTASTYVVSLSDDHMHVSCRVVCDEGTLTSPRIMIIPDGMNADHDATDNAVFGIVPHSELTHFSVQSGNWSSASTWQGGVVPGQGAVVLIAHGHTVTYDVNAPTVRLDRVRIEGTLDFAIDRTTAMLVETLHVYPHATLQIGTSAARLPAAYSATVTFSRTNFKTNPFRGANIDITRDTQLQGRGLICQGTFRCWGTHRTPWLKTKPGQAAPMATDTSLTLDGNPTGWQVGDEILVAGTQAVISGSNLLDDTEEVTITGLTDNGDGTTTVTFTPALENDHDHHNASVTRTDLQPAVIMRTRNITFQSESTTTRHRGHVMVMHHHSVADIWDAAFVNLGRTDKSRPSGIIDGSGDFQYHDLATDTFPTETLTATSNIQRRYSLHLHHMGFGRDEAERPIVNSCHVEDSPGWGYVHHQTDADFIGCTAWKCRGAGMVSEDGNETGAWVNCAIIGSQATDPVDDTVFDLSTNPKNQHSDDTFRYGYAFAMRSRAMRPNGCYAGSVQSGYVFLHRDSVLSPKQPITLADVDVNDLPRFHTGALAVGKLESNDYPIIHFADNECAGAQFGVFVAKGNPDQGHDLNIVFKRFKGWAMNVHASHPQYIGSYALVDFDVVAHENASGDEGMHFGANSYQVAFIRPRVEGFTTAVSFGGYSTDVTGVHDSFDNVDDPRGILVELEAINCGTDISYTDSQPDGATKTGADVTKVYTVAPSVPSLSLSIPNGPMWSWNGGAIGSFVTVGAKTDSIGDQQVPKIWDGLGIGTTSGSLSASRADEWLSANGYWQVGGNNVIIWPQYFSDRLEALPQKRVMYSTYTGSTAGLTDNGAYTFSANAPVRAPITQAVSLNTAVEIDILTAATDADGNTITLESGFYAPDHGRAVIDTGAGTVTYTPDPGFVGTDLMHVWIYDNAGHYTRVDITLLVACTTPQAIGASDWSVAGGSGSIEITLAAYPDNGNERFARTEYTTDAGATWKRLCHGYVLDGHTITTESDGTALAAGGYTLALRYVTNVTGAITASASKAATVS